MRWQESVKLSVVIPVYNEERTIAQVIDAVCGVDLEAALGVPLEREIVVVDDGSQDGTRAILARYASLPEVQVVLHDCNAGKGAALRTACTTCAALSCLLR